MSPKKIGIFGGSFNPIHQGHLNSMLTVADRMNLATIKVVPARRAPLKHPTEGPTPEERFQMVKLGIRDYPEVLEADDVEIARDGVSYTVDTLAQYELKFKGEELYLIIGADQFEKFDHWKDFESILSKVHLIVTTRPGTALPRKIEDFPAGLRPLIEIFDYDQATLSNGSSITFIRLKDVDVSATEIRKRLRTGRSVAQYLTPEVEKFIRENELFTAVGDKIQDYREFTEFCAGVLRDKNAINIQGYDLRGLEKPSDYTLIASGTSSRHTAALAEHISRSVKDEYGLFPYNLEGLSDGRWVVMDYGNLLIHLFYDYVRMEYRLEDLWQEGARLNFEQGSKVNSDEN